MNGNMVKNSRCPMSKARVPTTVAGCEEVIGTYVPANATTHATGTWAISNYLIAPLAETSVYMAFWRGGIYRSWGARGRGLSRVVG